MDAPSFGVQIATMITTLFAFTLLTACTPKPGDDTAGPGDSDETGHTNETGETGHTDETDETGETGETGHTDETGETGETGDTTVCATAGLYGDPNWSLEVKEDCSAFLQGFCGEGSIARLDLEGGTGAFSVELTWLWQGAGPSGGEDLATFVGTIERDVVDGTLTWGGADHAVTAALGVTPGSGLGLSSCPLD